MDEDVVVMWLRANKLRAGLVSYLVSTIPLGNGSIGRRFAAWLELSRLDSVKRQRSESIISIVSNLSLLCSLKPVINSRYKISTF